MILKLKNPQGQFPPGGFPFTDSRTKMKWNGYEGTPAMTAAKVITHRRANPMLYPAGISEAFDLNSVVQEIFAQKFTTSPELFSGYGPPDAVVQVNMNAPTGPAVSASTPCQCGSNQIVPVYCQTCSGNRVTGYRCAGCKRDRNP